MNLLDAQTKATLEHGGAVILDSKYYVMTWETVERMIQAVTEMAYDSGLACNFEKAGALQTEKANRDAHILSRMIASAISAIRRAIGEQSTPLR